MEREGGMRCKVALVFVLMMICSGLMAADHFRSKASGSWNALSTWEQSPDSILWSNALSVPDAASLSITIETGHTVTITASTSADQLKIYAGAVLNLSASFNLQDGPGHDLIVEGMLINTSGTHIFSGTVLFEGNSLYRHQRNGGPVPLSAWGDSSTAEFTGLTATAPSNLSQEFARVIINSPLMTTTINFGGNLKNIRNDFHIQNTGQVSLRLTGASDLQMNIGGDLIIDDDIDIDNSSTGITSIIISGNLLHNSGTLQSSADQVTFFLTGNGKFLKLNKGSLIHQNLNWNISPNGTYDLISDIPIATGRNLTIDGTLNISANNIEGQGHCLLNGIVSTNHSEGLISPGNISALITIGTDATAEYRGNDLQKISKISYPNLRLNGPGRKILEDSISINRSLELLHGKLTCMNNATISLAPGGVIVGGSDSAFITGTVKLDVKDEEIMIPFGIGENHRPLKIMPGTAETSSVTFTYDGRNLKQDSLICNTDPLIAFAGNEAWTARYNSIPKPLQYGLPYRKTLSNGHWKNGMTSLPGPTSAHAITLSTIDSLCWKSAGSGGGILQGNVESGWVYSRVSDKNLSMSFGYGLMQVLPLNVHSFKTRVSDNRVELQWKADDFDDGTLFVIERSPDGRYFDPVFCSIRKKSGSNFNATDHLLYSGVFYYRVRASKENETVFSQVIRVHMVRQQLLIYKSSVSNRRVIFSLPKGRGGKLFAILYNSAGQTLHTAEIHWDGSEKPVSMYIPANLSAGAYFLSVSGPTGLFKSKLILFP